MGQCINKSQKQKDTQQNPKCNFTEKRKEEQKVDTQLQQREHQNQIQIQNQEKSKDQQIPALQQDIDAQQIKIETTKNLQVHLIPFYSVYEDPNVSQNNYLNIPFILEIEMPQSQSKYKRNPIDVVLIIDISGSMQVDNKLKLVQKSIKYVLKILQPQDRIALVTFNHESKIVTPFQSNNDEIRSSIKQIVENLGADGSTDITAGLDKALKLLGQKGIEGQNIENYDKDPQRSVCGILLSDGQDDNRDRALQNLSILKPQIQESFDIFACFGYGYTHDADLMNQISDIKHGSFYYIDSYDNIGKYFVLCLSGMLAIKYKNVIANLQTVNGFKVGESDQLSDNYLTELGYMVQNDKKQCFFDVVHNDLLRYTEGLTRINCLQYEIRYYDVELKEDVKIQKTFDIKFGKQQEIQDGAQEFQINHLKHEAGLVLQRATDLYKMGQQEDAQKLLQSLEVKLKQSKQFEQADILQIWHNIQQAKEGCQKIKGGLAVLLSKQNIVLERRYSINAEEDWDDCQKSMVMHLDNGDLDSRISIDSGDRRRNQKKYIKGKNVQFDGEMSANLSRDDCNLSGGSAVHSMNDIDNKNEF